MQQTAGQAGSPPHNDAEGARHVVRHYLLTEWPSAVLVAALVFILHHHSDWLKAVDGYAFLGIGRQAFVNHLATSKRAVVVEIDQGSFEKRYQERSPLSRCRLHEDLKLIYNAKPDLVAIDIDISPSVWGDKLLDEAKCQEDLNAMIETEKTNSNTTTVIMEPFPVSDHAPELKAAKKEWVKRMELAKVRFGDAKVPVNYGLVIKQYAGIKWFATQARAVTFPPSGQSQAPKHFLHIDPRRYAELYVQKLGDLREPKNLAEDLSTLLTNTKQAGISEHPYRVVFFGGAYGKDDIFETPLGQLYGVEIQAATYLSEGLKEHLQFDLLGDIVIAIVFGIVIAVCWERYFAWRISNDAGDRQRAPIWILCLIVSVFVLTLVITDGSLFILMKWGVWLSPVPIAIGMLIDSFVSGTVEQAVSTMQSQKRDWILELEHDVPLPTDSRVTQFLAKARDKQRSDPKNLMESLYRMLGGDIYKLLHRGQYYAATLLSIWTFVWMGAVGSAIWLAWPHY